MADPLSITASVLTVVTAGIQSVKSLRDAVQRYENRNKTLQRLRNELEDLVNILEKLEEVAGLEASILFLLKGPVSRCTQLCRDFEISMDEFSGKSKLGFLDWTKMEFMKGDINEFMDALAGYKSTISVGLGTITMQSSKLSQKLLEDYSEIIQDTAYSLNIHLQRVNEKLTLLTEASAKTPGTDVDLKDEKAVTEQCLRICDDARSYLQSLMDEEPALQPPTSEDPAADAPQFEAQNLTLQTLLEHRDKIAEVIGRMRERHDNLALDGTPGSHQERLRLQKDIEASMQGLEVCKRASTKVSDQKIYRIGEAVAEDDSDQVLVTTLADLFDVKKALSKGKAGQLIGSMSDESLQKVSSDRYRRFKAVTVSEATSNLSSSPPDNQKVSNNPRQQPGRDTQQTVDARRSRPNPNEMRKRTADGDGC